MRDDGKVTARDFKREPRLMHLALPFWRCGGRKWTRKAGCGEPVKQISKFVRYSAGLRRWSMSSNKRMGHSDDGRSIMMVATSKFGRFGVV